MKPRKKLTFEEKLVIIQIILQIVSILISLIK